MCSSSISTYRKTDSYGRRSLCEPRSQCGSLNYPRDTTGPHPAVTAHTLNPPSRRQRGIFIPAFLGTGGGRVSGSSEAWVSQQLRRAADQRLSCGLLLSHSSCASLLRTSISFFLFPVTVCFSSASNYSRLMTVGFCLCEGSTEKFSSTVPIHQSRHNYSTTKILAI